MTDYPQNRSKSPNSWKKQETKRKWHTILVLFICVVLFFAAINGIWRSKSIVSGLSTPKWDTNGSFAVALNSDPAGVFVFQKDPKRTVFLSIASDTYFETGNEENTRIKLGDIVKGANGEGLASAVSKTIGVKIDNFAIFEQQLNFDNTQDKFKDFTSVVSPLKILLFGVGELQSTNITRIDALRLWWQLKGSGVNSLESKDLSMFRESVGQGKNTKVLGADSDSISRVVKGYFENRKVVDENIDIAIVGASGNSSALRLATSFVENIGGKVVSQSSGVPNAEKCRIVTAEDSYTAEYLVNLLGCSVKNAQNSADLGTITLEIGSRF